MTLFANTSITAKRAAYKETLVNTMAREVASDLMAGVTTREIGLEAFASLVTAIAPNSGKGHAETMRAYAAELVDGFIAEATEEEEAA